MNDTLIIDGLVLVGFLIGFLVGRISIFKPEVSIDDLEIAKKTAWQLGHEEGYRQGETDSLYKLEEKKKDVRQEIKEPNNDGPVVRLGRIHRPTQADLEKKANPEKTAEEDAMRESLKDIPELNEPLDADLINPLEDQSDPLMVDTEG